MLNILRAVGFAVLLATFGAGAASAAPDASGSTTLVEPNGLYTAVKSYELYSPDQPEQSAPAGRELHVRLHDHERGRIVHLPGRLRPGSAGLAA